MLHSWPQQSIQAIQITQVSSTQPSDCNNSLHTCTHSHIFITVHPHIFIYRHDLKFIEPPDSWYFWGAQQEDDQMLQNDNFMEENCSRNWKPAQSGYSWDLVIVNVGVCWARYKHYIQQICMSTHAYILTHSTQKQTWIWKALEDTYLTIQNMYTQKALKCLWHAYSGTCPCMHTCICIHKSVTLKMNVFGFMFFGQKEK